MSAPHCLNAYTHIPYSFVEGSKEEETLFRVMPVDGTKKIYFDSYDEYQLWKNKSDKQYTRKRIGVISLPLF